MIGRSQWPFRFGNGRWRRVTMARPLQAGAWMDRPLHVIRMPGRRNLIMVEAYLVDEPGSANPAVRRDCADLLRHRHRQR